MSAPQTTDKTFLSELRDEPIKRDGYADVRSDFEDEKTAARRRPKSSRKNTLRIGLPILLVFALVIGGRFFLNARAWESTDDAFIEGHVIAMSPHVPAFVSKVLVDDNFEVKAGELLVELDTRDFEIAVAQARANVTAAEGRLQQAISQSAAAEANVGTARADLASAEANAENANAVLRRSRELLTTRVISKQELDAATAQAGTGNAAVEAARKKLSAAEAQIAAAQAQAKAAQAEVEQAQVQVRQAELQLSYCRITAPEAGRITRKSVEPGAYVQPGQTLFAIVPHAVWVVANFKETQLAHMTAGQPAEVKVDAFSQRKLRGHVDSIQAGTGSRFSLLPAENATGNYVKIVQRVPVKILLDEPLDVLRRLAPGMSVVPDVRVR